MLNKIIFMYDIQNKKKYDLFTTFETFVDSHITI